MAKPYLPGLPPGSLINKAKHPWSLMGLGCLPWLGFVKTTTYPAEFKNRPFRGIRGLFPGSEKTDAGGIKTTEVEPTAVAARILR